MIKIFAVISSFMIACAFAWDLEKKEENKPTTPQQEETMTKGTNVWDLWQEFQKDEDAAVKRYTGQQLTVNGIVTDTGISIYATPYVSLSNEKDGTVYAVCVLPRADFKKLSDYKKGETVAMTGNFYAVRERIVIKQCKTAK